MLCGREAHRRLLGELLARAADEQAQVAVLRGPAGIGKTALLEHVAGSATGFQVLRTAGVESESKVAFAGLERLLRPVAPELSRLAEPQRTALSAALGRTPSPDPRHRLLIGLAVLSLLTAKAGRRPLLCLVDDAQWLDAESLDAIQFAARRLDRDPVCVLAAVRGDLDDEDRHHGERVFRGFIEVAVGPLDPEATEQLLDGLPVTLDRRAREIVTAAALGNPLALLELVGEDTASGVKTAEALPARVARIYAGRARRLSSAARTVLTLAAADETGDPLVLDRAARSWPVPIDGLDEARAANLLRRTGDRVEFVHPLARSGVYEDAGVALRRRCHLALAEALRISDPEASTWHSAAAAVPPDPELAERLTAVAERARARGATGTAARAYAKAAVLSDDVRRRHAWLVAGARAAVDNGDDRLAGDLLDQLDGLGDPTAPGSAAEHLRGLVECRTGDALRGYDVLVGVFDKVRHDEPARAGPILLDALRAASMAGDMTRVTGIRTRAEPLLGSADAIACAAASLAAGVPALLSGDAQTAVPLLRRSLDTLRHSDDPKLLVRAATAAVYLGDLASAGSLATGAANRCRKLGDFGTLTGALEVLAFAELPVSPLRAEMHADEGLRLARDLGQVPHEAVQLSMLAIVAAVRGDRATTECRAGEATRLAQRHRVHLAGARAIAALGLLELGTGRSEHAVTHFGRLVSHGQHALATLGHLPDLVEAAHRARLPDVAATALARMEQWQWADRTRTVWATSTILRSRALLAPDDEAVGLLELALEPPLDTVPAFEVARTRLLLGERLRRDRRRVAARSHLRAAVQTFETLGADPWAARARRELRAAGEAEPVAARPRERLTVRERQVCELVIAGASTKEIAAQLFLSPRTVDHHLRKVFLKLGISSRRQLRRTDLFEL